jgi:CIC family chloride channel protein
MGPLAFALLASVLGVVAGIGAFVLRALIALFHNLFLLGRLSLQYDTNQHAAVGRWGPGVALAPAAGAVLVVFLIRRFAPEAKGHGVPEVMDAIYYQKSVIRPVVAVVKSLASAISIGSGGSVGREGPIIQIGAAFGSWFGRAIGVSRWQLATLVAAGGGAGIAATFNTPIGGVLFAVEVLMHEVSVRTLVPVAVATATATFVGQFLFGNHPAFLVPALHMPITTGAVLLPAYVGLGCLTALASVLFISGLYGAEDLFERRVPGNDYVRHVLGMLGVGGLITALMYSRGHYYVQGVGYATIMDILSGTLTSVPLLLALFALKLLATCLTLGSGASGGIFSPSLFMGATLGAAMGIALRGLLPGLEVDPAAFALAGMAGLVAGATGAALTAIVMIFEMTLDYSVVLPMTLTVAVSLGLRRILLAQSIYTMKLARRGHTMPEALQANAHLVRHVGELALEEAAIIPADTRPTALAARLAAETLGHFVVMDGNVVVGVLSRNWLLGHLAELRRAAALAEVVRRDHLVLTRDTTIFDALSRMQAEGASLAAVLPVTTRLAGEAMTSTCGLLTKALLTGALADGMELFGD